MTKRQYAVANELTSMEERAAIAYVQNGGDQAKAYRASNQRSKTWAAKTVWEKASRLFAKDKVQTRVQKLKAQAREFAKMNFDLEETDVLAGLLEEARFKGEGSTHAARVQAWHLLGKHFGIFERDNEHKNPFRNLPRTQLRELEAIIEQLVADNSESRQGADPATATRLTH